MAKNLALRIVQGLGLAVADADFTFRERGFVRSLNLLGDPLVCLLGTLPDAFAPPGESIPPDATALVGPHLYAPALSAGHDITRVAGAGKSTVSMPPEFRKEFTTMAPRRKLLGFVDAICSPRWRRRTVPIGHCYPKRSLPQEC